MQSRVVGGDTTAIIFKYHIVIVSTMSRVESLLERFPMMKVTSQLQFENNCPQFLSMLESIGDNFDPTGRSKARILLK